MNTKFLDTLQKTIDSSYEAGYQAGFTEGVKKAIEVADKENNLMGYEDELTGTVMTGEENFITQTEMEGSL